MATKADESAYLSNAWHVQQKAPNPYSQMGNTGKDLTANPNPVGYGQPGLNHAGYGAATALAQVKVVTPAVPATTVMQANTTGFNVTVTVSGGTVTGVKVGVTGQTYAQATLEATSTPATVVIPPNGVIGIAYSSAPTWSWTD